ncbi:MAG: PKD domain-containing protein, partial [Thermoguttaceae bacterium]|nr:PKD domain-containing protein [Thermoguttaceae bacterium]
LVSGELCFSAGNVAFVENTAEILGGAVVLGGDVEFAADENSAAAAEFEFTENVSNRYAPAVAVMTKPSAAEADALRAAFGLDGYSDALETFARYRTADIAYADLSFEYLADAIGASAEKIVANVSGTETGATLRPGDRATLRELGIGEVGEYEILCHANNDSKFVFAFHYAVTEFPSLTVWKEPSFDPNVAGISVRSYALDPIASWTVDWGDGESETFDALGFAQTAFHFYAEPGEYAATLEVVLANGLSETFDGVVFTTVAGEET